MRLRSNHVLEPVSQWQPTRRRRGTRGTSSQPDQEALSQPVNESASVTPARPARKGRPAKNGRKKASTHNMSVPQEEAPAASPITSPLSPVPSPLITPSFFYPSPTLVGPVDTPTISRAVPIVQRRRISPVIPLVSPRRLPRVPRVVENSPFVTQNTTMPIADLSITSDQQSSLHNPEEPKEKQPSATPLAQPNVSRRFLPPNRPRNRKAFQYGSATEILSQNRASGPYNYPGIYIANRQIGLPNGLVLSPDNSEMFWTPRTQLTTPEEGSRKRNRQTEDEPPMKRYRSAQPAIRPRGSSRTTYADRQRRRQAEHSGQIDRTMFRIPQRLAQQNADASSAPPLEETLTTDEAPTARQNTVPLSPSLPSSLIETTNQPGWGRWMFDRVTRRWTGLLGRRTSLPQVADVSHLTEREQQQSEMQVEAASRVAAASTEVSSQSASPQPTHAIRKNYDLFSRGYDADQRARWMSNPLPSSTENLDPPQSPSQQAEESAAPDSAKRKQQPSPDVIPNPPGCSYGLNDDYFIYDDEDWAAQEREHPDATPTKSTTNVSPEEKERSSKRVRIEHPANFNHQGHFETPGWSSTESSSSTGTTPLGPHATGASPRQATVESVEHGHKATRNGEGRQATIESVEHDHKASRHGIAKKNGLKKNGPTGSNDRRLLKKARDQAEQYKPKTPSRLRSAHRFSGGPDSGVSDFQRELMHNSEDAIRRRRMRKTSLAKACPTGDLRRIIWPEFDTWVNRLSCFINQDVVEWVHTIPQRKDKQMLRDRQKAFNLRFLEELDKKRADPNYVPHMWDCPK